MNLRRIRDPFIPLLLAVRGAAYRGDAHRCPVCGSRIRAFCGPGGSFRRRDTGYCPRCNSKSRHRFLLSLVERGQVPGPRPPTLLVAPAHSELVAWRGHPHTVVDNVDARHVDTVADVQRLPFGSETFRTVVCIHVLEHVDDDRAAIHELRRITRPGGIVIVGIPFDGRAMTDEDPDVVDPEERRLRFGEADHRRAYGMDVADRFGAVGFRVSMHLSRDLDPDDAGRLGVRPDEAVLVAEVPA